MVVLLLILHSLVGVALLGAITHQAASVTRGAPRQRTGFLRRYSGVEQRIFTRVVAGLYMTNLVLGALLYPHYRLDVRIPFEEMRLGWAVGLFELKEHFAGIGAGLLPLYIQVWGSGAREPGRGRAALMLVLAFVVWWDFLVGHVLNNLRGLT